MIELVCPAGNLPSMQAAIDNGADAVYLGFRDDTNARHFPGLNLRNDDIGNAVAYAHQRQRKIFIAINTFAQSNTWTRWQEAVDRAAALNVDAIICADIGVLAYAHRHHPQLPLHLSVQASATSPAALQFYIDRYAVRRAVLPRVLSLQQIRAVAAQAKCDIEVFGFGSLCIMAEGRCQLSSYLTGLSPNTHGACSPAEFVRWEDNGRMLSSRLNGVLIDRFQPDEPAGYPTLCKGRFQVEDRTHHALEAPVSLNTLELLPDLIAHGVKAIKIEGRQRSPAYVAQVTRTWRQAIDQARQAVARGATFQARGEWDRTLAALSEGSQTTFGAYQRDWQ